MTFLDHNGVINRRRETDKLELQLAIALHREFGRNYNGLIGPLRDRVASLIRHIINTAPKDGKMQDKINNALAGEASLGVWELAPGNYTLQGLGQLLHRKDQWNLLHCGDILRLVGTVVEIKGVLDWEKKDKFKGTFRHRGSPGNAFTKQREIRADNKGVPAYSTNPSAWRSRKDVTKLEFGTGQAFLRAMQQIAPHLATKPDSRPPGLLRWGLTSKSVTNQIDKAFGLPFGADISGTTADILFGLSVAARKLPATMSELQKAKLLSLLPLATLVYKYHHTVLECALVLQWNQVIDDYCVGFYNTLWPKNVLKEVCSGIHNVLESHQAKKKHMLVYSRQDLLRTGDTKCLRGLAIQPSEIGQFRNLASMKKNYKSFAAHRDDTSATCIIGLLRANGMEQNLNKLILDLKAVSPDDGKYLESVRKSC